MLSSNSITTTDQNNMALLISPTTNEWPQNEHLQRLNMEARVMEKPTQQQQQLNPQESLKCPRCDSSNTKFCYYNNYSLSQPRHFCKACKRYWTRGGTLRNVPVGGGCRKNKKIKRSISAVDHPSTSSSPTATSSNPSTAQQQPPLFYGLPTTSTTNPSSVHDQLSGLPYNPSSAGVLGFDLIQPQMSGGFELGFGRNNGNYQNVHGSNNSSFLSSSYPMFGNSSANSPTIASLLGSSLNNQQKFMISNNNTDGGFQGLGSFDELQSGGILSSKMVKREDLLQNYHNDPNGQNHLEQVNNSSNPNLTYWNPTNINGAWLDPTNLGSFVPSLI